MKIFPHENAAGPVSNNRYGDRPVVRGGIQIRSSEAEQDFDNPVTDIRKQILVVQRSLGRYQSILGGLEGFQELMDSGGGPEQAARYLSRVLYRGEAVMEPLRSELNRILQFVDRSALKRSVEKARAEIHRSAVQLSRLETAEQNSRSLAASALSTILEGIRNEGDQLLNLDGKSVLDLLS